MSVCVRESVCERDRKSVCVLEKECGRERERVCERSRRTSTTSSSAPSSRYPWTESVCERDSVCVC